MVAEGNRGLADLLETGQITHDLRAGPFLRAYEFATQNAVLVDNVSFGNLGRAVEGIDLLIRVPEGLEVNMVPGKEVMVGIRVFINTDGDNVDIGHSPVKLEKARQLFDTGSAVCRPEIEDDSVAAQLAEIDGVRAVTEDELGRELGDVARVLASIATDDQ